MFYLVGHGSPDEFRKSLGNGDLSDNEHLQIVDDPAFFQGTEFGRENPVKVAVAKIAFAGDAAAITLGNRIYTKEFNYAGDRDRPCAISETEQDAVGDASLIGHELTHVVQQLAAPITVDHPQDNFWIKYAADYAANLAAGMSNKQAYENIPYEREAYAVGRRYGPSSTTRTIASYSMSFAVPNKLQGYPQKAGGFPAENEIEGVVQTEFRRGRGRVSESVEERRSLNRDTRPNVFQAVDPRLARTGGAHGTENAADVDERTMVAGERFASFCRIGRDLLTDRMRSWLQLSRDQSRAGRRAMVADDRWREL